MSDQNSSFELNTFQLILVDNNIPNYIGDAAVRNKVRSFPFNERWIEDENDEGVERSEEKG